MCQVKGSLKIVLAIVILVTLIVFLTIVYFLYSKEDQEVGIRDCLVTVEEDLAPGVIKVTYDVTPANSKKWISMGEGILTIADIPSPYYYTYPDRGAKTVILYADVNGNKVLDDNDISKICGKVNLK